MAKDKITDFIVTEKGADFLKRAAAGARLIAAIVIMLLSVVASAHETALCPQWPAVNPDKPLRKANDGVEVGMLNIRWIAKDGTTNCNTNAGHPNSCEKVVIQWSRRYDVFPFPIGNRLEYHRDEYIGGITSEAYCQ